MKKPDEAAVLHLALGALKPAEVPVGHHDLSRVQLTLTFPDFCSVDRAAGSAGDGTDEVPPVPPGLSLAAVLLFLERAKIGGPGAHQLWLDCLRDAHRGMTAEPPPEALDALQEFHASLPPPPVQTRKTPAKRTGASEVIWVIKRLPRK